MKTEYHGGLDIGGILLVVFITLKLIGRIDWSWWWVLSPLWIGLAIGVVLIVGCLVLARVLK